MSRIVNEIRVFVASPGDVKEEREKLREIIEELNRGIAEEKEIVLRLVSWQTDSFPDVGEDAQDVINSQIGPYDIFIGIMWKRIGTPTKRFPSGTVEEFELAYQMKNKYGRPLHIMFYFSKKPFYPSSNEIDQFKQVTQFKEKYINIGLYCEYKGSKEFQKLVKRHLEKIVMNIKKKIGESNILDSEEQKLKRNFFPPYSEIPFLDISAQKALNKLTELIKKRKNIIVTGSTKHNKLKIIKKALENAKESLDFEPRDILYVYNFTNPERPISLIIPTGKGRRFKESMENLLDLIEQQFSELIKSSYYAEKRDSIIEDQQRIQKEILKNFEEEVAYKGFAVIQEQVGAFVRPDLVPIIDGDSISFDKLEASTRENKFPKEEFEELKKKYKELIDKLEEVFERIKEIEEETKMMLKDWDRTATIPIINNEVAQIKSLFQCPKVSDFLDNVTHNLMEDIDIFKSKKEKADVKKGLYYKYRINLIVDNSKFLSCPVKIEVAPDQRSLLGSIEYDFELKYSDFRDIIPGAFYLAYGGFLVLDGNDTYLQENGLKIIKRSIAEGLLPRIPFYPGFSMWPEQPDWDLTLIMYAEYKSMNVLLEKEAELQNIFPTILRIS